MLGFGGREKITIDLANGLSKRGNSVVFVTLSNNENKQAYLLNSDVKLHEFSSSYKGLEGFGAIVFWLKFFLPFRKLLRTEKPDVVHTHLYFHRLLFVSIAIKFSGIKIKHFHTIHTSGLFYKEKGIINKFRLRTEQKAISLNKAYIIAIAQEVYKNASTYFSKISSGITLIYNGVNAEEFDCSLRNKITKADYGFSDDDIIITYLARITEGKDHLSLLKAWKGIVGESTHIKAKLCLAGDGELKQQMQEYCEQGNIISSVVFLGMIKDVPKLLAVTDIGVFTSLFEGFSVAVIEQMFMQVPVIATNISPFNHFIKNNYNGFLFETGDVATLAALIVKLTNDEALRTAVGAAGYKTAQSFSSEKMIAEYEKNYAQI